MCIVRVVPAAARISKGIDAGVVYFTLNIYSSCVWLF